MIEVVFILPDGTAVTAAGEAGNTVMETARANGIDGVLGDCGGALACATCHVHVDPAWLAAVDPMSSEEANLLEMAIDPDATSRLSCQIRLSAPLEGLTVRVPEAQF